MAAPGHLSRLTLLLRPPDPGTGRSVARPALRAWADPRPAGTLAAPRPRRLVSPGPGSPPWKDSAPRWKDAGRPKPGAPPASRGGEWSSRAVIGSAQVLQYRDDARSNR